MGKVRGLGSKSNVFANLYSIVGQMVKFIPQGRKISKGRGRICFSHIVLQQFVAINNITYSE